MPGAARAQLDIREFRRALKEIARTDKMGLAFVLNDQGIRFCQAAIKRTIGTPKSRIRRELSRRQHTSSQVFSKKGKRLKRARKVRARDTLAMRLVNKKRIEKGGKPVWGKNQSKLKSLAEQFIITREISANYVKAGWISPIKDFLRALGRGGRRRKIGKAKVYGPPLGWGKAARPGFNPVAWIVNQAIVPKGKYSNRTGKPMKVAQRGAEQALRDRVFDMRRKIEERLNRDHRKHQGK